MSPEQEQFFVRFYKEHLNQLIVHAYCYTQNWDIAKDVVQDSFHTALTPEKLSQFLNCENPIGWMKNVVKNKARNAARAKNRQLKWLISIDELNEEPASFDYYPIEEDIMAQCDKVLSKNERYLLKRIALDKARCVEVAEELGVSMWACYKRLHAIRKKLDRQLHDDTP